MNYYAHTHIHKIIQMLMFLKWRTMISFKVGGHMAHKYFREVFPHQNGIYGHFESKFCRFLTWILNGDKIKPWKNARLFSKRKVCVMIITEIHIAMTKKSFLNFLNRFSNFPWMLFDFGDYQRHLILFKNFRPR